MVVALPQIYKQLSKYWNPFELWNVSFHQAAYARQTQHFFINLVHCVNDRTDELTGHDLELTQNVSMEPLVGFVQ